MILWESKYELGIETIDLQHRQLVEMASGLSDLLIGAQDGDDIYDDIMALLDSLTQYTIKHFEYEEMLMDQAGYHALDVHQQEHRKLIEDLQNLDLSMADIDQIAFGKKVLKFLITWVFKHISGTDFLYKDALTKEII